MEESKERLFWRELETKYVLKSSLFDACVVLGKNLLGTYLFSSKLFERKSHQHDSQSVKNH